LQPLHFGVALGLTHTHTRTHKHTHNTHTHKHTQTHTRTSTLYGVDSLQDIIHTLVDYTTLSTTEPVNTHLCTGHHCQAYICLHSSSHTLLLLEYPRHTL